MLPIMHLFEEWQFLERWFLPEAVETASTLREDPFMSVHLWDRAAICRQMRLPTKDTPW